MKAVLLNTKHDQRLCIDGRYLCDAVVELIQLHHPFAGIPPACAKVDLPHSLLIDLVDHLHQRITAGFLLLVGEQVALLDAAV